MSNGSSALAPANEVWAAFWTTGDDRLEEGTIANKAQMSVRFQQRAVTVSTSPYTYGEQSVYQATLELQRNVSDDVKFNRVYFVGHANATGFFFSGTRNAQGYFATTSDNQFLRDPTSDPVSKDFFDELAKHLAPGCQIGFLACHGAKPAPGAANGIVGLTATALSHKGVSGSVRGYKNTYIWWYDEGSGYFTDKIQNDATKKMKTERDNQIPQPEATIPLVP